MNYHDLYRLREAREQLLDLIDEGVSGSFWGWAGFWFGKEEHSDIYLLITLICGRVGKWADKHLLRRRIRHQISVLADV